MQVSGRGLSRRGSARVLRAAGLVGLLVVTALSGCRRENPSNFDSNLAPETFISGAPAESSFAFYQVHVFWNGSDPDGVIDHYEFAVTDSNKVPGEDTPEFSGYFRTDRTDSVFRLSADNPQILGHRFYVRAVDNEGKTDPTPAWTYFIANDFNFPNVVFTRGVGTWSDRYGNPHSIVVKSNNRFDPTDTIGVGGCVDYAWDGFDVDPGGFVTGFLYRESASTVFLGGTLADTAFAKCYTPTFNGKDAVHVKAVDDAGAATFTDSVRAVKINFNPVTWLCDPNSPTTPVRARVFTDDRGEVRPSGTILANGFRNITFAYTGFDDDRDARPDVDDPGVNAFAWRRLENGGGPAYREISLNKWEPFPAVNVFDESGQSGSRLLTSADWTFFIRSKDIYGLWGRPETLLVRVNYPAFFTSVAYVDTSGAENPLWDPAGTVLHVDWPTNGGTPPPLHVRFQAIDVHSADSPDPLEISTVVEDENGQVLEYRTRINGSSAGFEPAPAVGPAEVFLPVSLDPNAAAMVRPGLNTLDLAANDDGEGASRRTDLTVRFCLHPDGQTTNCTGN